jgi:hypothetical protein
LQGTFAWYWNPDPSQDGVNSTSITFSPQGLPAQQAITDAYSSTDTGPNASPACYVRGTKLATPDGERAIEDLEISDLVLTASGEARPVRWIGHRAIDTTFYRDPSVVWPIRVSADAFAKGQPQRAVWLSPGHRVVMHGALIPIELLCNGQTIRQDRWRQVEYWHVELPTHDIIHAHGLPAETYLDTGNRTAFINGGDFIEQYPDFKPKHETDTCLPLVTAGPVLHKAKAALLQRLATLGHRLTDDSGVHLIADGKQIWPIKLRDDCLCFVLPEGCKVIRLSSQTFVPAHVMPETTDPRELGVCVSRLQINGNDLRLDGLKEGWHKHETDHRWSDGYAELPEGARLVVIGLVGQGLYWEPILNNPGETSCANLVQAGKRSFAQRL